jgi:ABC-type proline/glycine betaine transport system ATPase subunit
MTVTLDHVSRAVDGIPHISDVALSLESGTLNVLLGPTLSGKTSIMRLLAGLDKPTTGRVLVNGKDVTGIDVRQRSVAMVYQQFINYPSLTVYENIASPLRVQGKPREEIEKRVAEAARLLRLEPFLKRTPLQLSGGQQQRTAIARALVKGADLVLLDEPLANLDYKLREELRAELPRIFEASGAIFVYATTEPSEALLLGGRTVCMWEGQILQTGDTPKVYRHPDTLRDPVCRWHRGAGIRSLCRAQERPISRRLPRPSVAARQRAAWPPRVSGDGIGHRDHLLGKLRASHPRLPELGRGAAWCARVRARARARRRARSRQRLRVRDRDGPAGCFSR